MDLDPVLLARLQFAFTIIFHIIFPSFTIGLSAYIATLGAVWLKTGNASYHHLMRFWTKIFAVSFAMGVVSGIVLSYQFGTNWSRFSVATGNVLGPLLGYEVLAAFFLEATFLSVLLFGFNRVPPWLYVLSAAVVATGTAISAFWILSANSWMQTPTGYEIVDGRFEPADWVAIIFNPSFPYRLLHTVTGFYVSTGFLVIGAAAWLIRGGRFVEEGRLMLSMTLWLLSLSVPLQIWFGDMHGLNTRDHQPAKLAAIEARWETERRVPLTLFALPDEQAETNRYALEIPLLGSIILTHDPDGEVKGLKDFPRADRPPVAIPFFAFRIMVGIGSLMLALVVTSWILRLRRRLDAPWFLLACELMSPLGLVAVVCGWLTTEVGRQPWTVYGLLRTAESVSPALTGRDVLVSLLAYALVYLLIFPTGLLVVRRFLRGGPTLAEEVRPVEGGQRHRPVGFLGGGGEAP